MQAGAVGEIGRTRINARSWRLGAGLAVAVAAIVSAGCGQDSTTEARTEGTTSTTERETEVLGNVIERDPPTTAAPTTTSVSPSTTPERPSPSTAPSTTAVASPTTTALPTTSCDPRDVDCDGWWWSSPPEGNEPLALTAEVLPPATEGGEGLQIAIHAEDPDALVGQAYVCISATDGSWMQGFVGEDPLPATGACLAPPQQCSAPQGEVPTPPRQPSARDWLVTFDPPSGSYAIDVAVDSHADGTCVDPYGSSATWHRTRALVVD